jgi:hypothetical protein
MTIKNYLMVNKSTNIVENRCLWDGNVNTWQPPNEYLMLDQETTPAIIWKSIIDDKIITDWVLTETLNFGDIGFTWNGTVLTTNQPKPTI